MLEHGLPPMPATQLCLLDAAAIEPTIDPAIPGRRRIALAGGAWIDYAPRWVVGDAALMAALSDAAVWTLGRRRMYERTVDVPRLTAPLPEHGGHPLVARIAAVLSAHYGESLTAIALSLYRDGSDSVAWHRDQGLREQPTSTMAIVSLGEPRPFRLRPLGGGASVGLRCGWGDLVVMGGTIQRTWEHAVPKLASSGPRMSIMFRCPHDTARA